MKNQIEKMFELKGSLSLFKEELTQRLHKTGAFLRNDVVLPVNNFIKDITQIEKEFEEEQKRNAAYCIYIGGAMVPAEDVLTMPMEENY